MEGLSIQKEALPRVTFSEGEVEFMVREALYGTYLTPYGMNTIHKLGP